MVDDGSFPGGKAALLAAGLNLACGMGCASSRPVCGTTAHCSEGTTCVAGNCRGHKQVPAPQSAQRVVLEPLAVAFVSSRSHDGLARANIPFGKNALGDVVLLLKFPTPFSDTTRIESAFIVMDPAPGAIPGPAPVKLRVARILEPWKPEETRWGTLPHLSAIEHKYLASIWGGRILRIEVTEQVKRWRHHRADDQGLAVWASPQNDVGATYSLGMAGGSGPRLDVYLR